MTQTSQPAARQTWRRKTTGQHAEVIEADCRYVYTKPISPGRRSRILIEAFTRQWELIEAPESDSPAAG